VLIVNPGVPANGVQELIALAKKAPGKLNFASAGNGTTNHLSGELFKSMANIDIVHVPYRKVGGNYLTNSTKITASVPIVSQPAFIRINPDRLATLSLCRAANAVEQVAADPTTWFFIILDLNRAVTAALVAALSAYDFTEAYDAEFRARLKAFLEDDAQEPGPFRVPFMKG